MLNLVLLAILSVIGLFAVASVANFGRTWLYGCIIANLLFISVFGSKLVTFYGFTTNVGNVFYACVFFAIYLLIEHYGAAAARRAIWIGFLAVILFIIASQIVISLEGSLLSATTDQAIRTLFEYAPRLAFASVISFTITQYFNIWLYATLRAKTGHRLLWLRVAASVLSAQALDSILFFSIAFAGTLSSPEFTHVLWVGYGIKVLIGLASIPLMYLSFKLKKI